jgi:hypothetical protein
LQDNPDRALQRPEGKTIVGRNQRRVEIAGGGDQPQTAVDDPDARARARKSGD